jgi:hypothetical protein
MELTPKTKLFPLLEQYPFLVDYLAGLRPQYAGLRNPALRKAFTRLASLSKVSAGAIPSMSRSPVFSGNRERQARTTPWNWALRP